MDANPVGGSMIKQAREVFPQCGLGYKKERGVKVWELRVEMEELQEVHFRERM